MAEPKCLLKNQDEMVNEIEMAARAALEDTNLTSNFKRENNLLNKSSNAVGAFPLVLALFQYRAHTYIYILFTGLDRCHGLNQRASCDAEFWRVARSNSEKRGRTAVDDLRSQRSPMRIG